jgi:hypothetical protein
MPTAARLIAGLFAGACFVGLGGVFFFRNPDFAVTQRTLYPTAAIVGFLVGWLSLGPRAGGSLSLALINGFRAIISGGFWLAFVGALSFAFDNMRFYKQLLDFMFGVADKTFELIGLMLDPTLLIAGVVAGIICGLLTEFTARIWN